MHRWASLFLCVLISPVALSQSEKPHQTIHGKSDRPTATSGSNAAKEDTNPPNVPKKKQRTLSDSEQKALDDVIKRMNSAEEQAN